MSEWPPTPTPTIHPPFFDEIDRDRKKWYREYENLENWVKSHYNDYYFSDDKWERAELYKEMKKLAKMRDQKKYYERAWRKQIDQWNKDLDKQISDWENALKKLRDAEFEENWNRAHGIKETKKDMEGVMGKFKKLNLSQVDFKKFFPDKGNDL